MIKRQMALYKLHSFSCCNNSQPKKRFITPYLNSRILAILKLSREKLKTL